MKRKIKINREANVAYIPKDLVEDGFRDDCDAYADAFTLTVVKPGTSLNQIKRSLQLVLQDIEMREELTKAVQQL